MENTELTPAILWMLVFSTVIYLTVGMFRKTVEKRFPEVKKNPWWTSVLIPLPILAGLGWAVLLVEYPYPIENPSTGTRAMLGIVAGGFSSLVFHFVKTLFQAFAARQVKDMEEGPESGAES